MVQPSKETGQAWQVGVWDKMAQVYEREIDVRFSPVIERVLAHAGLARGESVLDLGAGTGSVALAASAVVGNTGTITAVDISHEMLAIANARAASLAIENIQFMEGSGEAIPVAEDSQDAVLASLSMMYVIDRAVAAREIARVLRPGGRLVASVWAGADRCDIVAFQQIAGQFAPAPPVDGVGPAALADPSDFLAQLAQAGLDAKVEVETTSFAFDNFESAWDALAGVTVRSLEDHAQALAKAAVSEKLWPEKDEPRDFHNETLFIVAGKPRK